MVLAVDWRLAGGCWSNLQDLLARGLGFGPLSGVVECLGTHLKQKCLGLDFMSSVEVRLPDCGFGPLDKDLQHRGSSCSYI